MMTRNISLLRGLLASLMLALGTCLALPASAQDSDPGRFLPEETTMVVHLRAVSSFTDLEEDHPIRRAAAHPAFAELLQAFRTQFELLMEENEENPEPSLAEAVEQELGVEAGELSRLFPGQFTLAMHVDTDRLIEEVKAKVFGNTAGMPQISDCIGGVLVADTTADEDRWATLLESAGNSLASCADSPGEIRIVREASGDLEIIRLEIKQGESDWYPVDSTIIDGKLVISISPNTTYFLDVAQRITTPGASEGSLAGSESYAEALGKLAEPDFLVHVVLEDAMRAMDLAITEAYATMAEAGPNPATMLLPEANLRRSLGLTDFKDYTTAIKILPDGAELLAEMRLTGRSGLLAQLMEYGAADISLPSFDPAGVKTVQVNSYDFSKMLELVLDHAPQISPLLGGMLEMQLMNLQTQGLDVRGGLIPALGEGFTLIETHTTADPPADELASTIWLLGCKDPEALAAAIEGLRTIVGQRLPLEESEPRSFRDVTIHGIGGMDFLMSAFAGGTVEAFNYAIVDDQLVITTGKKETIEHAISCLKDGSHDLAADKAIAAAWNRWDSENLISFSYMDGAQLVRTMLSSLREGLELTAETDELLDEIEDVVAESEGAEEQAEDAQSAEVEVLADELTRSLVESLETLPDLSDMHFYLMSKSYQTETSIVTRGFFGDKPE